MKNFNHIFSLIAILFLGGAALQASAQNTQVIKIYRDGEVIRQYKASEIDYIEVADETAINDHEYVDLGLPSGLKWATCNIGADSASAYGSYFAWGDIVPKETFTEEDCPTYEKEMGDISGDPQYDAATAAWGAPWRMPSRAEYSELLEKCTWTWTEINGVNGYKVTGPNGNNIFLPAAGFNNWASVTLPGEYGCYWSSTPFEDTTKAAALTFDDYSAGMGWNPRSSGQSVRPVAE